MVRRGASFFEHLDDGCLLLVLEHDHSGIAELHSLVSCTGSRGIRGESASKAVNVLVIASLNEQPLNLRNLSRKATGDFAFRVEITN